MPDERQPPLPSDARAPAGAGNDAGAHPPRHPGPDPRVSVYAASDTDLLAPDRKLVAVGYTHRTADLETRARFAVARRDLPVLARDFRGLPGVGGCVVLGTCNRLEAYLEIRSEAEAEAAFVELVGGRDLEGRARLARALFVCTGEGAVRHLFRVAAGLDAMVLGDDQILGQAKEAYRQACQHGTAGPMLHKVFHAAFRCAKRVRTETALGEGALSVAGAALSLLAEHQDGLRGRRYLLVGVGDMTVAAARRLSKSGAERVVVCNRTGSRARELAAELGIEAVPWSSLWEAVAAVDAVVTSTASREPILGRAALARALAGRPDRPLRVLDIAVPPDVEPLSDDPAAADPPGLHVLDLEDVGRYQERTETRRCQASAAGEAIVLSQAESFLEWLRDQTRGPRMERLRREAEEALARELARLGDDLDDEERRRFVEFGGILIKRFLGAARRTEDEA